MTTRNFKTIFSIYWNIQQGLIMHNSNTRSYLRKRIFAINGASYDKNLYNVFVDDWICYNFILNFFLYSLYFSRYSTSKSSIFTVKLSVKDIFCKHYAYRILTRCISKKCNLYKKNSNKNCRKFFHRVYSLRNIWKKKKLFPNNMNLHSGNIRKQSPKKMRV